MKKISIFSVVLALAVLFTGCVKESAMKSLKELEISNSYVSIPPAGGSSTVTFKANEAWKFKEGIPAWINISATSGAANAETAVTFSADACEYGREAVLQIETGVHVQFMTVRQGDMVAEEVTCKEAMTGTAGKTYKIKGAVTKIVNTTYGNLYLTDGSITPADKLDENAAYVYGTLDAKGAEKNFLSLGIEIGDVITIEGPLSYYGTTPELVNVTVLNIEKSLLKLDKSSATVSAEGGEIVVKAAYKGSGVFASFDDKAEGWLSLKNMEYIAGVPSKLEKSPADTAVLTFSVAPNTAKLRSSVITVTSSNAGGSSNQTVDVTQLALSGTLEHPFSVAEAIEFCGGLSGATTDDFYVSGVISKIVYKYSANYGTATFWISEDGNYYNDKTKDFEAYSVYWLGNKSWEEGFSQIEVGANVLLCGQLTNYNGTAETNSKKAYLYSINGQTDATNGIGVKSSPLNIAGAISYCSTLSGNTAGKVWVKGKVSQLTKYQFGGTGNYNTASFWLSDDGKYNNDLTKDFEAYSIFYMNNPDCNSSQAFPEGGKQVAVGQEIVLCGLLTNYNGTCETASKKAYIYSIDGATE